MCNVAESDRRDRDDGCILNGNVTRAAAVIMLGGARDFLFCFIDEQCQSRPTNWVQQDDVFFFAFSFLGRCHVRRVCLVRAQSIERTDDDDGFDRLVFNDVRRQFRSTFRF